MPEREPQIPERIDLHERGGLTPAHWQEVIKRLPPWRNLAGTTGRTDTKLYEYAWNVIEGEFAGTQGHHQEYLGSRHWSNVLSLFKQVEVRIPRKIGILTLPLLTEVDFLATERASEVRNYASIEKTASYTLNDHIYNLKLSSDIFGFQWWNYYEPYIYSTDAYYIDKYSDHRLPSGRPSAIWLKSNKERINDENELLRVWLLTKEDTKNFKDPLRTDPHALERILRDIPVEVLNERLRAVLDELSIKFQLVGGWEK